MTKNIKFETFFKEKNMILCQQRADTEVAPTVQ